MSGAPPNYYKILEVSDSASTQQIRDAYKKAALKTHPDRVPTDSPERAARTRKFQLVNDAYYTLSDASRRREYDAQRKMFGFSGGRANAPDASYNDPFEGEFDEEIPTAGASAGGGPAGGFPSWAWNYFTGQKNAQNTQQGRQQAENEQFGDVFEEMLRDEGLAEQNNRPNGKFWGMAGGVSGGVLGFILANFPGLMAGAVAGNRLGAVRDAKGKSVYEVFQTLPQSERATLLTQLAAKIFSHTVGV
ncbi:DnaJ domain-containing protein [Xylariales sp. AK1849]|nr:DnaJ domain-containing protein [Xylariales sp. AK1849]